MLKYVVGIIIFAVGAVGAFYAWEAIKNVQKDGPEKSSETIVQSVATTTYATSTFSLVYPEDFTVNDKYAYDGVPNKPISGVQFTIPITMATGTNLSAFDTGISVEWLPRAKKCTGDIYVLPNVKAYKLTENGVTYSVATTSEVGTDDVYEEYVFALTDSSPCTAVRYFIHSTDINAQSWEGADPAKTFDRTSLLSAFDKIRSSLVLTQ